MPAASACNTKSGEQSPAVTAETCACLPRPRAGARLVRGFAIDSAWCLAGFRISVQAGRRTGGPWKILRRQCLLLDPIAEFREIGSNGLGQKRMFKLIPNPVGCFRSRHPGNTDGVIRDRYKWRRPLRSRIRRKRRSGMTNAELLNRMRYHSCGAACSRILRLVTAKARPAKIKTTPAVNSGPSLSPKTAEEAAMPNARCDTGRNCAHKVSYFSPEARRPKSKPAPLSTEAQPPTV